MRIQLIISLILLSSVSWGRSDSDVNSLFVKYDLIMSEHKIELIDEVFTKKFIQDSGGKNELIEKIKSLPLNQDKSRNQLRPKNWKKGRKDKSYSVKVSESSNNKSKSASIRSEFIVLEEDGKLKIDGTISDAE